MIYHLRVLVFAVVSASIKLTYCHFYLKQIKIRVQFTFLKLREDMQVDLYLGKAFF